MNQNGTAIKIEEADLQALWAANPLALSQIQAIILSRRNQELEAKLAEVNMDREFAKDAS